LPVHVKTCLTKSNVAHIISTSNVPHGRDRCSHLTLQAAPWGGVGKVGVTCLRPVESNAGVGYRDRAAQKVSEGMTDRRDDVSHTIRLLYNDA